MKLYLNKNTLFAAVFQSVLLVAWLPWLPVFGADELTTSKVATEQELSVMRGGFITNEGLMVSFGIERAIYVNGVLDTASNFIISSIDNNSALKYSTSAFSGENAVKVVQIGPAGSNTFSPANITGNLLPGGFTVIQNSLDNQFVNNTTIFNASVTNSNLFREMNLTSLISQQMIRAVR